MPHLPDGIYVGPLLYVIHAPINPTRLKHFTAEDRLEINKNRKKILDALNKAGIKKIPVLYEVGSDSEFVLNAINEVKHKPRIIFLSTKEGMSPGKMREILEREKITPTKIAGFGVYRNLCVLSGLETIKRAFPKAEVTLLEGSSTFNSRTNSRTDSKLIRETYRMQAKRAGIRRTKKLSFRKLMRA